MTAVSLTLLCTGITVGTVLPAGPRSSHSHRTHTSFLQRHPLQWNVLTLVLL